MVTLFVSVCVHVCVHVIHEGGGVCECSCVCVCVRERERERERERRRERAGRERETDLLLWIPLQICRLVLEMNTKELPHHQNPAYVIIRMNSNYRGPGDTNIVHIFKYQGGWAEIWLRVHNLKAPRSHSQYVMFH